MQLFYDPELSPNTSAGHAFKLNAEESKHCAKVLRMRAGGQISITNGKGGLFKGILSKVDPGGCHIEITESVIRERRDYRIHIAVSPVKNMSRFEWFLEKATEAGIDKITPLICSRTEKLKVRTERLVKVITSAMKQSLGVFHPELGEPMSFNDFVRQKNADTKFIGWCETMSEPFLGDVCQPSTDVIVLVGPEGDFTDEEVKMAINQDYLPISLGKNRLRTETAALAACFAVHFKNLLTHH